MRPVSVRLSAAGFSQWIGLSYITGSGFGVSLGVAVSSGSNLVYTVQHTFDDIYTPSKEWSGARVTTTVSITKVNHGLSVGDWWKTDPAAPAPFAGEFAVAAISSADVFTYTVADSGATATLKGDWEGAGARVFPHATLAALTSRSDGNYLFPPRACRLTIPTYTSGFADLMIIAED